MLAWAYERTGSLVFPWAIHAVANLGGALLSLWPGLFRAFRGE
jgi:membrane protease YdiL (CAAX protease family)